MIARVIVLSTSPSRKRSAKSEHGDGSSDGFDSMSVFFIPVT